MVLVPINHNVTQRQTKWICVCPNCQCERIISYCQKWNIETKKCTDICQSCRIELDLRIINTKGLEIGKSKENQDKAIKNRTGIKRPSSKKVMDYVWLFKPESIINESANEKRSKAKIGKFGPDSNGWKDIKSPSRAIEMGREPYKNLRKEVFKRDNYTCKICLIQGGQLEMDHIKEWCNYPELRYEPNNCRTLCKNCHKDTDNYSYKAKKRK
jgi:hypothetical protein